MYVDAITLAAVADELRALLTGARVEAIIPPTEHSIAIECYCPPRTGGDEKGQKRWLYLSAHPQLARLHLTLRKPPRAVPEPPPFVMLLRKYLEGARLEAVEQPRWERVLHLLFRARVWHDEADEAPAGETGGAGKPARSAEQGTTASYQRLRLIAEIMGRTSNILLCNEEGLILGCHKRIGADINRYRVIMPNVPYVPPPPQQRSFAGQLLLRLEPTSVTAAQLSIIPGNEGGDSALVEGGETAARAVQRRKEAAPKLWQLLVRHLLGFSPLLAREAVYRTLGKSEAGLELSQEQWEELAWNIRDLAALYTTHRWHPQLVERLDPTSTAGAESGARATPLAFAPYVLEQYSAVEGVHIHESSSINVLIDDFYARSEWLDALESRRVPLRKLLQREVERCRRRAAALEEEQGALAEAENYRRQGELLLTFQHEIGRGQTQVSLPDLFAADIVQDNPPEITIELDPRLDAVGNANRLFARYQKMRRAAALLPEQIERNGAELATLEQLLTDLQLAETPEEIELVKAEIQAAGYLHEKKSAEAKAGKKKASRGKAVLPGGGAPLYVQSRDGFTLLVGRNSRQNEEVTFRQASGNDIWLHARGVPGAHVIVKAAGRQVPQSTLEQAASLAAYYSQARDDSSVPVDYTLQRHVRHMKGGGPGMVVYDHERTIYVRPSALP
ncbi:Rqc2 family fibronectin-binding protein [Thermogemmatispora carboxidivorans]|uniref:Rqc2 family fibronectin-binding protein n=1 Tax=Thermogemmatispora carboxidivorans TaxID=1382306 RepID=UPI00069C8C2E|nr:NFACT RNA binding domain-containing protein [Thermogemmatispora carboxidivorans]